MSTERGRDVEAEPEVARNRTSWTLVGDTPLRRYLHTETGSALVLLAATAAALVWVNVNQSSYVDLWSTQLSVQFGDFGISQDLQGWINSGLMTFFFFVVGLETRREFDIGELRERRRIAMPLLAGLGGMAVAVALFLVINVGQPSAHGWGVAMSTDTAFALGVLALFGPRITERLRGFLLTVVVVDDIVALIVIATVYSETLDIAALFIAGIIFIVVLAAVRAGVRHGLVYLLLGVAAWISLYKSGIDPIVIGLAMGLLTWASPAGREDLERATDLFRLFREQPTSELARDARLGLNAAVSPNERLQNLFHPWTSYVVVPLFALANAGIVIDQDSLSAAVTSPIVIGVVVAYVVGKPVGVTSMCWLVSAVSRGRIRPPVGWAAIAGAGTSAGIGFTVALLIASLAFAGQDREQAILGVLVAAVLSTALTWLVFRVTAMLPPRVRVRALLGDATPLVDLALPPDPSRDHIRGPHDAPVTLVEFGDFECPYCGQAESAVRELLAESGDVRYVWRHLPLTDVHPRAQLAAEAAEAAAEQDQFWPMCDLLFQHQDELTPRHLIGYAGGLGLDVERFTKALKHHAHAARIAEDVEGAAASGVVGTPTFFINGQRHHGAFDLATLSSAVKIARKRAFVDDGI
ncbi:MAG TPA: Na+/H+ antiporter NhaA [Actinomycetes bacterium]|nr:Na+/H+ antiporter NhaA [Actinomycetes bacterium]